MYNLLDPSTLNGLGCQLRLAYCKGKLFFSLIASILCFDHTVFLT